MRCYAHLMQREALLVREAIGDAGRVWHIHFGGGSPELFGPQDFSSTMAHLCGLFDLEPHAEIAAELEPRAMNDEAVSNYAACGVNRISFGVQESARHAQGLINRVQSFETVRVAVNAVGALCEEMGFAADSLDTSLVATSNFEALSIITRSGRDLRINEEGCPFVRSITACFDTYFVPSTQEEPRHRKLS